MTMFGLGVQEFMLLLIILVPIILVVVLDKRGRTVRAQSGGVIPSGIGAFTSASSRARWTIGLLIAMICLDVIAIASGLLQASLVGRVLQGVIITPAEAVANDSRQQLIGNLWVILYVATVVAFFLWLSRSYRNVSALTTLSPSYSPAWAVGSFFMPFLWLTRPLQIIRELWHLSDTDPSVATLHEEGRKLPTPSVVGWWWGIWLVSVFLSQVVRNTTGHMNTPQEILNATYVSLASDFADLVAAGLAIAVVRAIDRKQVVCHNRLVATRKAGKRDTEHQPKYEDLVKQGIEEHKIQGMKNHEREQQIEEFNTWLDTINMPAHKKNM